MNGSSTLHNNLRQWRIFAFIAVMLLVLVLYVFRLIDLQILNFQSYLDQANENRITDVNLPALRGIIYDRNGIVLASNIPSYNVVLTYKALPDDPGAVDDIFHELSRLTGVPLSRGEITDETPFVPCISDHGILQVALYGENSSPYQPVRVACDISRQAAMVIEEKGDQWTGISIEVVAVRDYPTGSLTAGLVGFLGPIPASLETLYRDQGFLPARDKIGYAGVELEFQDILAGKNGLRVVERDSAGLDIRDLQPPVHPIPGNNVSLTIDTRLQQAVEAILIDEINFWNIWLGEIRITSGTVVAINPQTGEILAMVNYPTYENNRMARVIPTYYYLQLLEDKRDPLYNRAVYAELPAGSVFKLVTAVGAINEEVVTLDQMIKTPGVIILDEKRYTNDPGRPREFVDWVYKNGLNPEGFGQLDIIHCISNSSNTCFYKLGGGYQDEIDPGLGICRLGTYARALGFGNYPEIELPEVADGLIPDPDWKRIVQGESWTTGDTYIMSVGQGYALATPLQVLMSAATIANDGKLMEPTLLRDVLDAEGNVIQPFEPKIRWDLTQDPIIEVYDSNTFRGCRPTGEMKTVEPWVFEAVQQGMRLAVLEGTLKKEFADVIDITVAGKTGTAEYCDEFAKEKNKCIPGEWPTHAWTVAYAPFDNPEIAVVAFLYNGGEGASVAGPVVRRVIQAYFDLKSAIVP